MKFDNVWYSDGSLRDIYILGVTLSHWQRVVDWLHTTTNPYCVEFYLDDELTPLPWDSSTIFEQRNERAAFLTIDVESVIIYCHFFRRKEIEFNIDPSQVESDQKEEGVTNFMRALGRLLNKEVILTPENRQETSLLTYLPEQDEIVHDTVSLKPSETITLSREQGLIVMAKVYGLDEDEEAVVLQKMLEAANKAAYEEN